MANLPVQTIRFSAGQESKTLDDNIPNNSVRKWRISVQKKQKINLQLVTRGNAATDPTMSLFDVTGHRVLKFATGKNVNIQQEAPNSGEYHILIDNKNNSGLRYTLTVNIPASSGPEDGPITEITFSPGQREVKKTGKVAKNGIDRYKLRANATQKMTVTLTLPDDHDSDTVNEPVLRVINLKDKVNLVSPTSRIQFASLTLPVSGEYEIDVYGINDPAGQRYELKVDFPDEAEPVPTIPTQATVIRFGLGKHSATYNETIGANSAKRYRMTGRSGSQIRVDLNVPQDTDADSKFEPKLVVYQGSVQLSSPSQTKSFMTTLGRNDPVDIIVMNTSKNKAYTFQMTVTK